MTVHALPVRQCVVVDRTGAEETTFTVHCPRRTRATAVRRCGGCPAALSFDPDHIICETSGTLPNGRVDVAEAAVRTAVGTVLRDVVAAAEDTSIATLVAVLHETSAASLTIVDDGRRPIGIVTARAIERHAASTPNLRVSALMTPLSSALREDAPIVEAIALFGVGTPHEMPSELPVVDLEGRLVGVVTPVDVLRFVAGSMGYEASASR